MKTVIFTNMELAAEFIAELSCRGVHFTATEDCGTLVIKIG